MSYLGMPAEACAKCLGDEYIQHNPDVANGTQGFIDYFVRMQAEYPEKSIDFVRCIAEGDMVASHTHQTWPGNDQWASKEFFQFDKKGKICGHWNSFNKCL